MGALAKLLFGISPEDTTAARRGFRGCDSSMQERIARIGRAFTDGYHAALEGDRFHELRPRLEAVDLEFRGFAYEGAAMGLALLDRLTPWHRGRVCRFLNGPGEPHTYMVHVAVGWVVARLPVKIDKTLASLDPLLRWLVLDGYGFHEGFFFWPKYLGGQPVPKRVRVGLPYAPRAFDQGLGRSLWFIEGGEVTRLRQTIASFPAERQ